MTKTERRNLWMGFAKDWLSVNIKAVYERKKKTGKQISLLQKQNLIVKLIEEKGYTLNKK